MKRLILGILTLLTIHLTYGQETKSTVKKSNGFKEEFSTLAADKKVKHGKYKKYTGNDQLVIEGTYDKNEKIGEWNFYANGELEQTYDFTKQELKYSKKTDNSSKAIINGAIQEVKLDTPPFYIGSKVGLNDELNRVISYPYQALRMGIDGKVHASVWVTETNEIVDIKIIRGIMGECDQEVIKGLNKVEMNWIAGTKNGNKVKSELLIVVEFKLYDSGKFTITVI